MTKIKQYLNTTVKNLISYEQILSDNILLNAQLNRLHEEMEILKVELSQSYKEIDILRKAAVYFADETSNLIRKHRIE